MEGRSAVAIEAGKKVANNVKIEMIDQFPGVEFFKTIPIQSLVQFGLWDEILKEDPPAERLEYANGIWHYARAVAFANKGEIEKARAEQAAISTFKENQDILFLDSISYPASMLLQIAEALASGEIALAGNDPESAISHFTSAVAIQDKLPYTEPPFWYYPSRLSLGKALLASNLAAQAEQVYQRNLERYPRNGWALYGLMLALSAQGKETSAVAARFDTVWANADVTLTASRF
jgi:tetratricopeptide (TPR) repeat protein